MTHPPGASGGAHPLVPVSALLGGALALAFGAAWLLADPGALAGYLGSPRAGALTHLFTLLHVTLVYAGTLQQLPAVLLVADLAWKRLGYVALPLLVAAGGHRERGSGAERRRDRDGRVPLRIHAHLRVRVP